MKLITLLSIASFIAFMTACGDSYEDGAYYEDEYDQAYTEEMGTPQFAGNNENDFSQSGSRLTSNGELTMQPIPSTQQPGMIFAHMPLPSNWKIENGIIIGPNGIKAGDLKGGMFLEQQRRLTSAKQVAQEDIFPKIQQVGGRVTNTFMIPEIANYDRNLGQQYWKVSQTQDTHEAMGIEADGADGTKGLAIIHFTYSRSQLGNMAFYYVSQLTTKAEDYEQAKKAYIYALANVKVNPQAIAAHNQREQQKSQSSWNAHNQRMANNNATFQARQKAHVDSYNAISDMSMDTYWNNSAASDRMQGQIVDGIWEQQNMYNPQTGQQYKVQSGYNQYYMNGNNQYMGTNDYNYNPNVDPNFNNSQWQQLQPANNNYNY